MSHNFVYYDNLDDYEKQVEKAKKCDKLEQDNLILAMENDKLHDEVDRLTKHNNELRLIYRRTYKKLFENGHDELANYFMAQIDDCPTFTVETVDWYEECKRLKSLCIGHEKELRTKDIIIKQIREECESKCEKAINQLDIILNVMKDQPTRNPIHDDWLINRLLATKVILNGDEEDGNNERN